MDARGLHLRQQIDRPHRRRHKKQFSDDVRVDQRQREIDRAQIKTGRRRLFPLCLAGIRRARLRGHERQQVPDVNDALGIVEGLVVNHQARMCRAFEQAHQLAKRNVALDCDNVGAMDHHVGDAPLMQAQNIAQHGALDGGKADFVRRRSIEHDLQVVADRSRLPSEQGADRADQPVVGGRTQYFALLYNRRQVAHIAWIVVGRLRIRHLSPSVPDPHTDPEFQAVPGSPARAIPSLRRRRLFRGRNRSSAGSHEPPDG